MATKEFIIESLKKQIEGLDLTANVEKIGTVVEISDGIARISGLTDAKMAEMLEFPGGTFGVALNLEENTVGAMLLGEYNHIKQGTEVKSTGRSLSVPVSSKIVGRVVDPLGRAIDGKGDIAGEKFMEVDKVAPGVITRQSVDTPLQTGIKAIDSMIPIGRGQRELIIGDRQTGKTAIAIDTIINQKGKGVICIYVAIGQKESKVAQIVAKLEQAGAMDHTVVVVAGASDPASLSYIAPYTGTAIGEFFMELGKDALVVHDDLSKHAWAYREVSLLLRRPPGGDQVRDDEQAEHGREDGAQCAGGDRHAAAVDAVREAARQRPQDEKRHHPGEGHDANGAGGVREFKDEPAARQHQRPARRRRQDGVVEQPAVVR